MDVAVVDFKGRKHNVTLNDVVHVPDMAYNLLSVTRARKIGVNVNFGTVPHVEKNGVKVIFEVSSGIGMTTAFAPQASICEV